MKHKAVFSTLFPTRSVKICVSVICLAPTRGLPGKKGGGKKKYTKIVTKLDPFRTISMMYLFIEKHTGNAF